MRELFSIDGSVGKVLTGLTDLLTLSVLWVICSIPVVTAGAATTALYTMTLRIVRNEEGKIAGGFWQAFRSNFKKATCIHLLVLVLTALLSLYWVSVGILPEHLKPFFRGASILFWLLWLMEVLFVYPVQARFENTVPNIMKNAWLMALGNLPSFLLILLITSIPVWIFVLAPMLFLRLLPVWIFFAPGVLAWLNSFLFQRCFRRYIPTEDEEGEE